MCGRAAQTIHAANIAGAALGARTPDNRWQSPGRNDSSSTPHREEKSETDSHEPRDNYNMSPGMDAFVIWKEDGELVMDRKVWGLVTKGGSEKNPLPSDSKARIALHFQNLMYNARTDTLFTKPTFSRLASQKRSCIVAMDGYFEWKASPLAGGKGRKQPYFVYRNARHEKDSKQPYLLMPGLWTRVSTGLPDDPTLDTFTILTTEACKQIEWLHHRMPVCIWDVALAMQWLDNPTPELHQAIEHAAKSNNEAFDWHMVTTDMSSVKFRGKESIQEKKGPKPVTAFFGKQPVARLSSPEGHESSPARTRGNEIQAPTKHSRDLLRSPDKPPLAKKPKLEKGRITAFFHKK